jgi:hypothetical protein
VNECGFGTQTTFIAYGQRVEVVMCSGKQQAPIFDLRLTWPIVLFVYKHGIAKLATHDDFLPSLFSVQIQV